MQRIKKFLRNLSPNWEIITIFFVFIATALFLGDGIQPLVDVYLGICVVLLYLYSIIIKKVQLQIPRTLFIPWALLLGYLTIRSFFSDSVALSIWATMRWYLGFLVFVLFSSITGKKGSELFVKEVSAVSIFAIAVSFILIIFPGIAYTLPPMNLLYASWGHNHLPALLFFTFPYVYHRALNQKSNATRFILILYLFAIAISFSKSALLVILLYFGFNSVISFIVKTENRLKIIHVLFFLSTIIILLLILILGRIFTSQALPLASYSTWFRRQAVKPIDFYNVRGIYWQQALSAFTDQPLFGHGPGTFYLLSKRYQQAPNQYSYFAHSWPLELLAESGITGLFLLAFLIYKILNSTLIFTRQFPQPTTHNPQLLIGIFLVLGLSLIDFNFNFLVIWLLMWSSLAFIFQHPKSYQPVEKFKLTLILYVTTAILFLNSVVSLINIVFTNQSLMQLSKALSVFDRQRTIELLTHKDLTSLAQSDINLIYFFHRSDGDILIKLTNHQIPIIKLQSLEKLFKIEKFSWDNYNLYLQLMVSNYNYEEAREILTRTLADYFPDRIDSSIVQKYFREPISFSAFTSDTVSNIFIHRDYETFMMKLYYLLGKSYLKKNPRRSQYFWRLALQTNRRLGILYAELASLEKYIIGNKFVAEKIISTCRQLPEPNLHCQHLHSDLSNLTYPGELTENVLKH